MWKPWINSTSATPGQAVNVYRGVLAALQKTGGVFKPES